MKFVRGFAVVSLISASLPLAVACGSASNSDLFSPSSSAGANADHTAGVSSGGASDEGGNAGAPMTMGGAVNAGDTSEGGGDTTAGGAMAGGSATEGGSGGSMAGAVGSSGAGGSIAGAGGSTAGAGGAMAGAGGTAGANGGAGGMSGGAGAAGASTCPAAAPKADQFCAVSTPDSCFYAGNACSCLPANQGGGQFKQWGCYGTPDICPDTKPTAGLACKQNIGANCPYPNDEFCACVGNNNEAHWVCEMPAGNTCAAQKPQVGSACGPVRACQYSDDTCFCNGVKWGCEGG